LDRRCALPLEKFPKARNDLARQLERDGDADEAGAVQVLPKPTVAAWTVNQLSRHDAAADRALLSAGEALRKAQERLLAGQDATDSLREATAEERDAIRSLSESGGAAPPDAAHRR